MSLPPTPEPLPAGEIDFVMEYGFAGAQCPFADRVESGTRNCFLFLFYIQDPMCLLVRSRANTIYPTYIWVAKTSTTSVASFSCRLLQIVIT